VIVGELGDRAAADAMLAAASDAMDGIDVLVNNAGLTRDNLAMRIKDEDWQAVIDVNLTATFPPVARCSAGHDEGPLGQNY
jgi:3-oxoacyl-[acyl-carrier protein] reductase